MGGVSMDIRFVTIKEGWAVLGDGWAVFGATKEEAEEKYYNAEVQHAKIMARDEPAIPREQNHENAPASHP